jgi:Uma2 family endonuclease
MSNPSRVVDPPQGLVDGQRLDQPTFHALYEAMPPGTWAELINGVVSMSSPVGPLHGGVHALASGWVFLYEVRTPGVRALLTPSTVMELDSETQPDVMLRVLQECGGQTRVDDRFVWGAPELVVEVAHTSRVKDLGPKLEFYERAGVQEYVVIAIKPDEIRWFVHRDGSFVELQVGADDLYRSEVFPGLWLDPKALLADDVPRIAAVVEQGCATPEHAEFVARLAARQGEA